MSDSNDYPDNDEILIWLTNNNAEFRRIMQERYSKSNKANVMTPEEERELRDSDPLAIYFRMLREEKRK